MRIPYLSFVFDRKGQADKDHQGVVELKISQGKTRKYISTGVKLFPREWKNGSVVWRDDCLELNDQLHLLKKRCSEIVTRMMSEGCLDFGAIPGQLKDSMMVQQTFLEYAENECKRIFLRISEGTKERYDVWFRFMRSWGKIVYFADVTDRNVRLMDEELEARGLKKVSRWSYHKTLKTFVFRAMADGLIKKNPYAVLDIKKGNEGGLTRYLTPEEFHRFESCKIDIERLERVRDLFVFQTYTMMSYGDMADFNLTRCFKMDGKVVYKGNRNKTGQEFTIVLLPAALAVLNKYGGTLPIISNVKYNAYLKAAVLYAHIDKHVTTHWARHTGATMMVNEGIPMHIVQHMLGHASIRETERTYAKVLDTTIVNAMSGVGIKKA